MEDEENLVRLLRGYLEREGFEVHEALDGVVALEAARDETRGVAGEEAPLSFGFGFWKTVAIRRRIATGSTSLE